MLACVGLIITTYHYVHSHFDEFCLPRGTKSSRGNKGLTAQPKQKQDSTFYFSTNIRNFPRVAELADAGNPTWQRKQECSCRRRQRMQSDLKKTKKPKQNSKRRVNLGLAFTFWWALLVLRELKSSNQWTLFLGQWVRKSTYLLPKHKQEFLNEKRSALKSCSVGATFCFFPHFLVK